MDGFAAAASLYNSTFASVMPSRTARSIGNFAFWQSAPRNTVIDHLKSSFSELSPV